MLIPGMAAGPFSTFATRYAHHYELSYDQLKAGLGSIAIKTYDHGHLNPKAALHKTVTMEQYLQAPMISWPLGLHDCCVMPNGAAAAVISRAEIAGSTPVSRSKTLSQRGREHRNRDGRSIG